MKNFLKRTVIGLGLVGVLLIFVYLTSFESFGLYLFNVLVLGIAAFCTYEVAHAMRQQNYRVCVVPLVVLMLAMYPMVVFFSWLGYLLTAAAFLILAFGFFIFDTRVTIQDFLATVFVGIYPFLLISVAFLLTQRYGMLPLLVALGGALCSDAIAYYAGNLLKGPKIFPKISPKKTVSGSVVGLLGGAVGTMLIYLLFEVAPFPILATYRFSTMLRYPILFYVLIGIAIALFSELGDLAASRIKRELGIKDYSHLLGAHGGLMDRLDSIMFALVFISAVMPFLPGAAG